ncbi:hypothetical protein BYT27DRAFT_7205644 [Phlegmacium glaucopus]|nr:hypothetical protein BYT27DRAFT_7205644 [Phlegmacium glaucopus]
MTTSTLSSTATFEQLDQHITMALDAGLSHSDIIERLRDLVLDRANKVPPRKVIINSSHGGFSLSSSFIGYLDDKGLHNKSSDGDSLLYKRRENLEIIAAITEFGRQASERLPFVVEDIRVFNHYKLQDRWLKRSAWRTTQSPELVEKVSQIPGKIRYVDTEMEFEEYATANPDHWMFREAAPYDGGGLWVAHTLLKDDRDKYLVAPDPIADNVVFELMGLAYASGRFSKLHIETVPAGVKYVIDEYDGMESVKY